MPRSILYIIFLLSPISSFAQTKGCFKAYASSGAEITTLCVNQEVTFQDCGNQIPDDQEYYVFDYTSGSNIPNVTSPVKKHTYTRPGKYRVLQIANYGGTTLTDTVSQVFEVKASPPPAFTVTACANNTVSVNITDTNYDSYTIDYGDGNIPHQVPKGVSPLYTYNGNGIYTITVAGIYTGGTCSGVAQKQVTTLPPPKPPYLQNLTVRQQNNAGEIQVNLQNLQPGYLYIVERWQDPDVSFQKIDTIKNVTQNSISYTLHDVNTDQGVWYQVRIADECNSISGNNISNIVSAIVLEATSGNEQSILTWQAMSGAVQYEVYRNSTCITTLNSSKTTYTDESLSCGQTYTYFVKGIGADGSTSISATQNVQVTSTTIPAAPYLLASFNLNNEVELSINLPQGKVAQKVDIQKSIRGAPYKTLASVPQPQYTDAPGTNTSVCYRTTFTDPCNNTSGFSNVTCPILLKAQKQADGAITLEWTHYAGFPDGVAQYTVELLNENGTVIYNHLATGTNYTDRVLNDELQILRYRIRAVSKSGAEVTYSNLVQIEQKLQLYIPSAFTPNGDRLNDVLEVKGRFIQTYILKVYNSLGNIVFQTSDAVTNWDGTYKGEPLPVGVYVYEITVKSNFGDTKRRKGTITLLR